MPYIGTIAGTTTDPRIPDPGTSGQVLKSDGSGSWQTQDPGHLELPAGNANEVLTFDGANWVSAVSAGGGGGSIKVIASGPLADGKTVILKSDGKAEIIGQTSAALDVPTADDGSNTRTTAMPSAVSSSNFTDIDFDPNDPNKFILIYRGGGPAWDLQINVGTISGGSITMGTPYAIPNSNMSNEGPKCKYHPSTPNLACMVWGNGGNGLKVETFIVSGTSITAPAATTSFGQILIMGMPADFNQTFCTLDWDPAYTTSNRFLVGMAGMFNFMDPMNEQHYVVAGTCDNNGTNVVAGSYTLIQDVMNMSGQKWERPIAFDPNTAGKFAMVWWEWFPSGPEKLVISMGSISGTTVTKSAAVQIDPPMGSDKDCHSRILWNTSVADLLLVEWVSWQRANRSHLAIVTVSGTTPTVGAAYEIDPWSYGPGMRMGWRIVEFGATQIRICGFKSNQLYHKTLEWTGTTITAPHAETAIGHPTHGANYATNDYYSSQMNATSNGVDKIIAFYVPQNTSSNYPLHELTLSSFVGLGPTNLTATNFLGISDGAYADGVEATIQVAGAVDDAQSGLTIGTKYYVKPDGTLDATANTPEVLVGTAVDTTKVLIADSAVLKDITLDRTEAATAIAAEAAARATAVTNAETNAAADATTKANAAQAAGIAAAYAVDTLQIVASGDLANGNKVILQSDGTAKIVANTPEPLDTPTSDTQSQTMSVRVDEPTVAQGSSQTDQPQQKAFISWDPLDENRFIIAYKDGTPPAGGTGYPRAVVGTISGTTISLGTPVDIDTDSDSSPCCIHFHPDVADLVAVAYGADYTGTKSPILKFGMIENAPTERFVAKSVLNMHLGASYGSSVPHWEKGSFAFDWDRNSSGLFREYCCSMDCWFDFAGATNYRMPVIRGGECETDGGTYNAGTWAAPRGLFTAGNYQWGGGQIKSLRFDPNTHKKFLYVHHYPSGGGGIGHALRIVNLDSNNYPNQGSEIQLTAQGVDNSDDGCYCEWNPSIANQIVFSGKTNNPATMCVGTVSGTSVSWGTRFTPTASNTNSSQPWNIFFALGSAAGRFYGVTTLYTGNSTDPRPLVCQAFDITGTTITEVGSPVTIAAHNWFDNTLTYPWHAAVSPSGRKFIVSHLESTGDTKLTTGTIGTTGVTNLTADNFLGISDGAYSSGATATVQLSGATDDAQSGLTTGSTYYVQPNGSLATTSATPSVFAGQALSATSLLIAATRPGVVGSQLPLPGTTGKILTSDGTNWTSGDASSTAAPGTLKPLHQGLFL